MAACSGAASPPKIFPAALYLGVEDSGRKYSAPIAVGGASPMAFSVADTSIATAIGGDQQVEVGALRVGSTTVLMRNDFGEASAAVSIATYSASARLAGQQAWTSFNCAGCHDFGPDVTPSGIARRADAQIEAAVVSGKAPDGGEISTAHSFAVSPPEGMVALLRSLPAREVPAGP
jgi:hypothetical protein